MDMFGGGDQGKHLVPRTAGESQSQRGGGHGAPAGGIPEQSAGGNPVEDGSGGTVSVQKEDDHEVTHPSSHPSSIHP